eukprot:TRINITY_DN9039_c0_g1_i2.p1 TRINITY_DN9039_c0_g1~~TRINITY_DN9039_c0_g1_i2.p1  ORF type:complete len:307 (-),score=39.98 TRINITY_DN9039_c0_g1_i2:495-1352(-)
MSGEKTGPNAGGALSSAIVQPILKLLPGVAHAATMIAVGYPFDTVKTRVMLQIHPSMLSCIREMAAKDGFLSLYRGCAMPLASLVCKRPFEFAFFEAFKEQFPNQSGGSWIGGCFAGAVGTVIGCPFSVIRIQMQASSSEVHSNSFRAIAAVWNARGFTGFYHGFAASVVMQVPCATLYLGTYGELRERLPKKAWSTALAGGVASLSVCTFLQPLDTVRTLIQVKAIEAKDQPSSSWWATARQVVQERGFFGLWAGWRPSAIRAIPTSAASMLAYESIRSVCSAS